MSWNLVLEHLFIVLAASLLSILVGVSWHLGLCLLENSPCNSAGR